MGSEKELQENLKKAKSGDQNATTLLTKQYSKSIENITRSYFLYGGDSDDLYQIGLIAFCDAIARFDSERHEDFTKFVKVCVHSKIIDAIKQANRKKHSPLNTAVGIEGIEAVSSNDPEKQFLVKEQLLSVYRRIDLKLSDYEKRVLNLYIDGFSYKEISERVGKSAKSVTNAITRIRNKLV